MISKGDSPAGSRHQLEGEPWNFTNLSLDFGQIVGRRGQKSQFKSEIRKWKFGLQDFRIARCDFELSTLYLVCACSPIPTELSDPETCPPKRLSAKAEAGEAKFAVGMRTSSAGGGRDIRGR